MKIIFGTTNKRKVEDLHNTINKINDIIILNITIFIYGGKIMYPKIGIRPCIDGRGGALKLRESLEE